MIQLKLGKCTKVALSAPLHRQKQGYLQPSGCCTGCSHLTETKKQQTSNEGGWVFRSGRGRVRGTGRTSAAPPATGRSTFPTQHRPKNLSILQRDIHLLEIKYCEDTRQQNQLSAAQEQHKDLCTILQGDSIPCFWEWVAPLQQSHNRISQGLGS